MGEGGGDKNGDTRWGTLLAQASPKYQLQDPHACNRGWVCDVCLHREKLRKPTVWFDADLASASPPLYLICNGYGWEELPKPEPSASKSESGPEKDRATRVWRLGAA